MLYLMIIVFISNMTEAIAGFGATIIAVILGAQFYQMEDLIPTLVPLNVLLSSLIVWRYHRDIDQKELWTRVVPFTALGLPLGLALFQITPGPYLKGAFGLIVFGLAAFELAKRVRQVVIHPTQKPWKLWQAVPILISGGIMQGLYASGGPFVVYYTSRAISNKSRFRATLSALWLVLNWIVMGTLFATEKIDVTTLKQSAMLLPSVLLGMFFGVRIHDCVSESTFKTAVYLLLAIAGASLVFRSL